MTHPETSTKKPRCHHISKIGARCHADVQTGKSYCFFHDPDQKSKQAQARKEGGEARSREADAITMPPGLPVLSLETPSDVGKLLAETVNQFRRREIDPPRRQSHCQYGNPPAAHHERSRSRATAFRQSRPSRRKTAPSPEHHRHCLRFQFARQGLGRHPASLHSRPTRRKKVNEKGWKSIPRKSAR